MRDHDDFSGNNVDDAHKGYILKAELTVFVDELDTQCEKKKLVKRMPPEFHA